MDLWQFSCYLDGFNARCRQQEINDLSLAVKIALYSAGSAFSKKRPPDAKQELEDIKNDIFNLLTNKKEEKNKELTPEEQIELLKKQMARF